MFLCAKLNKIYEIRLRDNYKSFVISKIITTFAVMTRIRAFLLIWLVCCGCASLRAQNSNPVQVNPEDREVDMDNPTFVPMLKVGKVLLGRDSIQYVQMNNVYVYPPLEFKNAKQRAAYNRLVYNVKKVLPIAKECNAIILEVYDMLQTLPNKRAKDQYLKRVEEDIKKEYTPRMKKLTYAQGKLLIKLVNRECNSSAYGLVKAFLGPIRAGFWQAFAWAFGASLTKGYDPNGTDRLTERVVLLVEAGEL